MKRGFKGALAGAVAMLVLSVAAAPAPAATGPNVVVGWGANDKGQLGDGSVANVVQVAAGGRHTLALTADGKVWALGANDRGQLGNTTTLDSASPVQVSGLSGGVSSVTAIAAGDNH